MYVHLIVLFGKQWHVVQSFSLLVQYIIISNTN